MTSREIIRRVLEYDHPPRLGMTFSDYQGQPRLNDLSGLGPAPDPNFTGDTWEDDGTGGETYTDEWGCLWRRIRGRTDKGEVRQAPIQDWADLDTYQPPSLDDPRRYEHCAQVREQYADKYLLGGDSRLRL